MSGPTQVPVLSFEIFAYGNITLYLLTFQKVRLISYDTFDWPYNPEIRDFGLGSSRFARRYLGNLN